MYRYLLVCLLALVAAMPVHAQMADDTLPAQPKDVLWSKRVIRELIVTREGANSAFLVLRSPKGDTVDMGKLMADIVSAGSMPICRTNDSADVIRLNDSSRGSLLRQLVTTEKFLVYEEWVFYREVGQMTVKIRWIAPADTQQTPVVKERVTKKKNDRVLCHADDYSPLFWISYEAAKPLFQQYRVGSGRDEMSLFEFMESRSFSSKIVCVMNPDGSPARTDKHGWSY